jgi:hypothetical protein
LQQLSQLIIDQSLSSSSIVSRTVTMRFEACLLGLFAASGAAAIIRCGTPDPTAEQMQIARTLQAREIESQSNVTSTINHTAIEVDTYAHIFTKLLLKSYHN